MGIGILMVGLAAGWWWWPRPTPGPGAPDLGRPLVDAGTPLNLVVITLDTTRADHIGAYGSSLVKTQIRLCRLW